MTTTLHNGWTTGLHTTLWTLAALTATATILTPIALTIHTARKLTHTRPAWWLRTLPTRRRTRPH